MIIKEDLELLQNLFEVNIGKIIDIDKDPNKDDVLISSYIQIPYWINGPKSTYTPAYLKTVSVNFKNFANPLKVEIEIIFNVDTDTTYIIINPKYVNILKKLYYIKERNNLNSPDLYKRSFLWKSGGGSVNRMPTDFFDVPFSISFNKLSNEFSFKLGEIKSPIIGDNPQFKYYYYLPKTSGGEIDMKVFGNYLVNLIISLINNFSKNISVPILLNSMANSLRRILNSRVEEE